MRKTNEGFCFWDQQQTPEGVSVRNAREARPADRPRRQGTARKTRPQRPLPLRIREALSRSAACSPGCMTDRPAITTF